MKKFKETVEDWKIDGVLLHNNMSCRPKLSDDYDIPCLDMNDPRKLNETQVLNKIESFIEILRERKKK